MKDYTLKNRSRVPVEIRDEVKKIVKRHGVWSSLFSERERMKFYCFSGDKKSSINNLIKKLKKKPYVETAYYSSSSYFGYRSSLFVYFKKFYQINKGEIPQSTHNRKIAR